MSAFWNRDRKAGLIVYPLGDAVGMAILGSFSLERICALGLAGALLYASEIPWWFGTIERRWKKPWVKTVAAIAYFNPLWIARHFLIIQLVEEPFSFRNTSVAWAQIEEAVRLGVKSFVGAVVLSIVGNYIIQNRIRLEHRFLASALFSGGMAMYYAFSTLLK
ncbi:MAG: hypothetical protein KDC45_05740 [Bacteroidetes bacterium]|nr:hypothetical protein [Bacteroidota bacterium]